jgi:putative FmdB family regulatory protein
MPIFEYVCKKCRRHFECLILGQQRPRCPACSSGKLERRVEAFAQGRPTEETRGLNTPRVIAHARALLGNIPTIPRYRTKDLSNPGRRSRGSVVG